MGRRPRVGGGYEVERAKELFDLSVQQGKPDYRYIAIAIGASPTMPPPWAVFACIDARVAAERGVARGNDAQMDNILDQIVRVYDAAERDFENDHWGSSDAWDSYRPPSLRAAILTALEQIGLRQKHMADANDDWFRDIREAWDWEQREMVVPENTLKQLAMMHLEPPKDDHDPKTTWRVSRVLQETMAAEMEHPTDPQVWAWVATRLDHEAKISDALGFDDPDPQPEI